MAHPTLPQIIASFQAISKQAEACDPELASQLNLVILDLQELATQSKEEQFYKRLKDASEIAAPFLKVLLDYFNGT